MLEPSLTWKPFGDTVEKDDRYENNARTQRIKNSPEEPWKIPGERVALRMYIYE